MASGANQGDAAGWLWSRVVLRHWLREWKLTGVLLLIVSLGVAVFLSIRLANKAAVSGFGMFTESLTGESDFLIRPQAGMIPDKNLARLRRKLGNLPVGLFPVMETTAVLASDQSRLVRVIGLDLVAMQNAANYSQGVAAPSAGTRGDDSGPSFLEREDLVFSGSGFSSIRQVRAGDKLALSFGDSTVELEMGAVLEEDPNLPSIPDNLLLMDLPALQGLIGRDEISRIEVRFPPGQRREAIAEEAAGRLKAFTEEEGWLLETPTQRKNSVTQMSAAFRMNLTILSGLALLVGTYLIMQAMEAAVIKRRSEIAVLRSLGVTPSEVRKSWLVEGLSIGAVGSLLGILIGFGLAQGMVGAIGRTVNTLYYETTSNAITLEVGEIAFSFAFGMLASFVAVLIPARDASLTPPAQMMRQGAPGGSLAWLRKRWLGVALVIGGMGFALLPPWISSSGTVVPAGGYVAAVLVVLGGSIIIGILFAPVASLLRLLSRQKGALRRYAASQLGQPVGRHLLTAAGLAVAIGMSAAMAILVASFENTLTSWINQILKADLYVAGGGAQSVNNRAVIAPETWQSIEKMPGVSGVDVLQQYRFTLDGKETFLGGADYHDDPAHNLKMIWLSPPSIVGEESLLEDSSSGFGAWISESFSRRFSVGIGDQITIPTPDGEKPLTAVGVYADYGNEAGMLVVHRSLTRDWFQDDTISNVAVYLTEGGAAEKAAKMIRERYPSLRVRTNARLREDSLRIFHQTFAVTYALEAIAVLIAVSGLGLALAGLLLERKDQLTTLKSLGATRKEIAGGAMAEGVGIALVGLIGGILMSFVLGWILIEVINPQSFGWTLTYRIPWLTFGGLALVTILSAAAVAYGVGYRNAEVKSDQED